MLAKKFQSMLYEQSLNLFECRDSDNSNDDNGDYNDNMKVQKVMWKAHFTLFTRCL